MDTPDHFECNRDQPIQMVYNWKSLNSAHSPKVEGKYPQFAAYGAALSIALTFSLSSPASADLFSLAISSENTKKQFSFSNMKKMMDFATTMSEEELNNRMEGFDSSQILNIEGEFRGISFRSVSDPDSETVVLTFDDVNGQAATITANKQTKKVDVVAPGIGVARSFSSNQLSETSRLNDVLDTIRQEFDTNDLLNSLTKGFASTWMSKTATDPVAGNPGSYHHHTTQADFRLASSVAQGAKPITDMIKNPDLGFAFNMDAHGSHMIMDSSATVRQLQLNSTASWQLGRGAIFIDIPLAYTLFEDNPAYIASAAIGFRTPVRTTRDATWSLTGIGRSGAVGSIEMASGAIVTSASLGSDITLDGSGVGVSISNVVTVQRSLQLEIAGFELPYDFTTVSMTNGLSFSRRIPIRGGSSMLAEFYLADTRHFRQDLYDVASTRVGANFKFSGFTASGMFDFSARHRGIGGSLEMAF